MTKVLLLSDTHSYWDERISHYIHQADEVWHAGDFGEGVAEKILALKPMRGVYGNIDDTSIRTSFPEIAVFHCENVKVAMMHIGGYPNKYSKKAKETLLSERPNIFISGHSHILKVMHDASLGLLHLNPGAAGNIGWHKVRTMLRFEINGSEIQNLEVIELGKRGG